MDATIQAEEGPYAVYGEPDEGYAPDAHRKTLEGAQAVAEGIATARGFDAKGLGYHWESAANGSHTVWTLRDVYDWARPTGISVEGPTVSQ